MTDRRVDERGDHRLLSRPEEFDFSASVFEASAEVDAAHLSEQLTLILGGYQEMKGLVRRLETLQAERARKDAERDAALAARLVTASELATAAQGGARMGAEAAAAAAAHRLDQAARMVETVNRRIGDEARQRVTERAQWIRAAAFFGVGVVLAILAAGGIAFTRGVQAGEARGYAEARDEMAAANWANTPDGRFAQRLYDDGVISLMRTCTGTGWVVGKFQGRRVCFGGRTSAGWHL